MLHTVPEPTRRAVAQTLPLLEQHQEALASAMAASLRAGETRDEGSGPAEVAAIMLIELLLSQGRRLAQSGCLGGLDHAAAEHRAVAIDGRHYSRFGDALVPILRDELGPRLPSSAASAWCDAFWAVVRAVQSEREAVSA